MKNASGLRLIVMAGALMASTAALRAAEVTYERLMHPEPKERPELEERPEAEELTEPVDDAANEPEAIEAAQLGLF